MKRYFATLVFLLFFIRIDAQNFPLKEFMNVLLNYKEYDLKKYVIDSTMKSKKTFLNKLRKIDTQTYTDLFDLIELNGHVFPENFLITDIDKDGNNEYFISENYEGVIHCNYTQSGNTFVKFLDTIPYHLFLIENPEKTWLYAQPSYLVFERFQLEEMLNYVYLYNYKTQNIKFQFKLYEVHQIPTVNDNIPYLSIEFPEKIPLDPKCFILKNQTKVYADAHLQNNYTDVGTASKGAMGWILSDTLNAYFVILDSNTKYLNDSLGQSLITYKDKGFMACWIPKTNVEFLSENGLFGTYKDQSTGEYMRFFETESGINVNYFTNKRFGINLKIVSFYKNENKIVVKFSTSPKNYQLEFIDNFNSLQCINPDMTKQIFKRL